MKDRCGFLFVRYKRHSCTELVSWEHAACPLSGIKKRLLMGGWLNTSSIVTSIGATASVRYREVVRSWEGPLWEVPLYIHRTSQHGYWYPPCFQLNLLIFNACSVNKEQFLECHRLIQVVIEESGLNYCKWSSPPWEVRRGQYQFILHLYV